MTQIDSESIIDTDDENNSSDENSKDDLNGLTKTIISKAKLTNGFLLFCIIILINTDSFIDNIMGMIPGTSIAGCPTTKGSLMQAVLIVLIFGVIVLLIG